MVQQQQQQQQHRLCEFGRVPLGVHYKRHLFAGRRRKAAGRVDCVVAKEIVKGLRDCVWDTEVRNSEVDSSETASQRFRLGNQTEPCPPSTAPRALAAQALQDLCGNTGVDLDLHGLFLGDEGVEQLAAALAGNTSLRTLNLACNRIGEQGARCLAEALQANSTLTNLSLRGNFVQSDGASMIAEALQTNKSLTHLDLGGNGITSKGGVSLANVLSECKLESLGLSCNPIGHDGVEHLIEAAKTGSIQQMDLSGLNVSCVNDEVETVERITSAIEGKRPCMAVTLERMPSGQIVCLNLVGSKIMVCPPTDTLRSLLRALSVQTGLSERQLRLVQPNGFLIAQNESTAQLGLLLCNESCSTIDDEEQQEQPNQPEPEQEQFSDVEEEILANKLCRRLHKMSQAEASPGFEVKQCLFW